MAGFREFNESPVNIITSLVLGVLAFLVVFLSQILASFDEAERCVL